MADKNEATNELREKSGMGKKYGSMKVFFMVTVLGALFLFAETVLQLWGRSLCASQGCGLASRLARFGDHSLLLAGLSVLALLGLLSGLNRKRRNGRLDLAINLTLTAVLAAEGFLAGYQIFWLAERCLLCLSVFGIFLVLGLLRLWAGWVEIWAGFAASAAVLLLVGLVLPPPGTALPLDKKMVLFTSADCRHCSEIKEEIARNSLPITPVTVTDYTATLKPLGIDQVPTLFVNGRYEKLILTGKEAIRRYLAACQSSGRAIPSEAGVSALKKETGNKARDGRRGAPLPALDAPTDLFNPAVDEGVCKEEQKCD
jgi:hypothetical protein